MNTRMSLFDIPFLLGFDEMERAVDDIMRGTNESYPPYNISQKDDSHYQITLAVAGFDESDLQLSLDRNQLIIRGKKADPQEKEDSKVYLHRGIAARQFERRFVLADGIEVEGADLKNGLLAIRLKRSCPQENVQVIEINRDRQSSAVIDAPSAKAGRRAHLKAAS